METVSLIVIALLILGTLWWILHPLWQPSLTRITDIAPNSQMLNELFHQRDAIYTAIKDLDQDLAADKISQADYDALRSKLKLQAAAVLKQIDRIEHLTDEAIDAEVDTLLAQFQGPDNDGENARLIAQVRNQILKTPVPSQFQRCPNCQVTVEAGDVFCNQCGTSLRNLCPTCEASVTPNDQFCAQCGTRLIAETVE